MVTVADPEEFRLATAVTVTGVVPFPLEVVGTPPGATNSPDDEIYPVVWLPPVTPLTCQVTDVLGTPLTVAVNCCVVKMATLAGFGVTVTATCCAIVTVADPWSALLAAETAVTITVAGLGMVPGAVYKPLALMLPTVVLPPVVPFTCQVTAVFVVPETVARNCLVVPGLRVAAAGVTVTVMAGGGGVPLPHEPRNRAARLEKNKTDFRMRSPGEGGVLTLAR